VFTSTHSAENCNAGNGARPESGAINRFLAGAIPNSRNDSERQSAWAVVRSPHICQPVRPDQSRCWTCAALWRKTLWRKTLTVKRQIRTGEPAPKTPDVLVLGKFAAMIPNLCGQVSFDIGPRCIGLLGAVARISGLEQDQRLCLFLAYSVHQRPASQDSPKQLHDISQFLGGRRLSSNQQEAPKAGKVGQKG
jgi:hypothetical protein